MAATDHLTEGTEANGAEHGDAGLPQMAFDTYVSQWFWLVVTFGFLFVVLSRVALPRVGGAIETRRQTIAGDLDTADRLRKDAANALQAYESSLAAARGRALALADENRKRVAADVDRMKAEADAKAQATVTAAETRIAKAREDAKAHVRDAAGAAAASIVERLTGERIGADEAAKAVDALGAGKG